MAKYRTKMNAKKIEYIALKIRQTLDEIEDSNIRLGLEMALKITEESKSLLICSRCHEAKSESDFYKRNTKGYYSRCKPCDKIVITENYIKRVESLEYRVKRSKQKKEYYERKKQQWQQ